MAVAVLRKADIPIPAEMLEEAYSSGSVAAFQDLAVGASQNSLEEFLRRPESDETALDCKTIVRWELNRRERMQEGERGREH